MILSEFLERYWVFVHSFVEMEALRDHPFFSPLSREAIPKKEAKGRATLWLQSTIGWDYDPKNIFLLYFFLSTPRFVSKNSSCMVPSLSDIVMISAQDEAPRRRGGVRDRDTLSFPSEFHLGYLNQSREHMVNFPFQETMVEQKDSFRRHKFFIPLNFTHRVSFSFVRELCSVIFEVLDQVIGRDDPFRIFVLSNRGWIQPGEMNSDEYSFPQAGGSSSSMIDDGGFFSAPPDQNLKITFMTNVFCSLEDHSLLTEMVFSWAETRSFFKSMFPTLRELWSLKELLLCGFPNLFTQGCELVFDRVNSSLEFQPFKKYKKTIQRDICHSLKQELGDMNLSPECPFFKHYQEVLKLWEVCYSCKYSSPGMMDVDQSSSQESCLWREDSLSLSSDSSFKSGRSLSSGFESFDESSLDVSRLKNKFKYYHKPISNFIDLIFSSIWIIPPCPQTLEPRRMTIVPWTSSPPFFSPPFFPSQIFSGSYSSLVLSHLSTSSQSLLESHTLQLLLGPEPKIIKKANKKTTMVEMRNPFFVEHIRTLLPRLSASLPPLDVIQVFLEYQTSVVERARRNAVEDVERHQKNNPGRSYTPSNHVWLRGAEEANINLGTTEWTDTIIETPFALFIRVSGWGSGYCRICPEKFHPHSRVFFVLRPLFARDKGSTLQLDQGESQRQMRQTKNKIGCIPSPSCPFGLYQVCPSTTPKKNEDYELVSKPDSSVLSCLFSPRGLHELKTRYSSLLSHVQNGTLDRLTSRSFEEESILSEELVSLIMEDEEDRKSLERELKEGEVDARQLKARCEEKIRQKKRSQVLSSSFHPGNFVARQYPWNLRRVPLLCQKPLSVLESSPVLSNAPVFRNILDRILHNFICGVVPAGGCKVPVWSEADQKYTFVSQDESES